MEKHFVTLLAVVLGLLLYEKFVKGAVATAPNASFQDPYLAQAAAAIRADSLL